MTSDHWIYSVWFRDLTLNPDEQDYEWVAVLEIRAETAALAKQWGDHLAQERVKRDPSNEFLWSEVLSPNDPLYADTAMQSVPSVRFGVEVPDAQLRW